MLRQASAARWWCWRSSVVWPDLRQRRRRPVAAYDALRHRLVLVTVRGNSPQKVTFDLSRFRTVGRVVRRRVTDAAPDYRIGRQYAVAPNPPMRGKQLTVDFSANSIQTIVIDDVRP